MCICANCRNGLPHSYRRRPFDHEQDDAMPDQRISYTEDTPADDRDNPALASAFWAIITADKLHWS
jgi:hypothetical protein